MAGQYVVRFKRGVDVVGLDFAPGALSNRTSVIQISRYAPETSQRCHLPMSLSTSTTPGVVEHFEGDPEARFERPIACCVPRGGCLSVFRILAR